MLMNIAGTKRPLKIRFKSQKCVNMYLNAYIIYIPMLINNEIEMLLTEKNMT